MDELDEYLNKIIKPALEEYAKNNNTSPKELLLQITALEDTKLFNYKGHQSTVYNRFHENNITNLKELFSSFDKNTINYGKDKLGRNYYIHNEIDGIISLLRYKYLGIVPEKLKELLEFEININYYIRISPYNYNHPGDVFNAVYQNEFIHPDIFHKIDEFYKTLKSCGFDQSSTKALIDIAYEEQITNTSLGNFLSNISSDKIKEKFKKVSQEYIPFINILNIILDIYKTYQQEQTTSHKKN